MQDSHPVSTTPPTSQCLWGAGHCSTDTANRRGHRQIRMVFHCPRVEYGVTSRRGLDFRRLQFLHEAVARWQVVGDDNFLGFKSVRKIVKQDVLRDVVPTAFPAFSRACRDRDRLPDLHSADRAQGRKVSPVGGAGVLRRAGPSGLPYRVAGPPSAGYIAGLGLELAVLPTLVLFHPKNLLNSVLICRC